MPTVERGLYHVKQVQYSIWHQQKNLIRRLMRVGEIAGEGEAEVEVEMETVGELRTRDNGKVINHRNTTLPRVFRLVQQAIGHNRMVWACHRVDQPILVLVAPFLLLPLLPLQPARALSPSHLDKAACRCPCKATWQVCHPRQSQACHTSIHNEHGCCRKDRKTRDHDQSDPTVIMLTFCMANASFVALCWIVTVIGVDSMSFPSVAGQPARL